MSDIETIGGYVVHPAAAVFPLIEGDDFHDLCESIRMHGVQHPVMVRGGELLDGRNRMRACESLKAEGWSGSCPVVEWKNNGHNVAAWIWDTNALRRHMSDDGLALASAAIWLLIAKENEAKIEATQFTQGVSGNIKGRPIGKEQATTKPSLPVSRDRKADDARSTVGQVAAKAGTSLHKARQAVAVQKAIEAGELPADTAKDVMSGKKKLKDVVPKPERKPRRKLASYLTAARAPTAPRAGEDIEPAQMLDEISYYALSFLHACPEKADELEGLLLTWVSRCKQR